MPEARPAPLASTYSNTSPTQLIAPHTAQVVPGIRQADLGLLQWAAPWVSANNAINIRVCNPLCGSANNRVPAPIRVDLWKHL